MWFAIVSFLTMKQAFAFSCHPIPLPRYVGETTVAKKVRYSSTLSATPENDSAYTELFDAIESIAEELWDDEDIPRLESDTSRENQFCEGEAKLPKDIPLAERGEYFRREALLGCPKAQHSYGLLLWSGFGGVDQNPEASARFHAAAACQNHLDGLAVFGGCLRTGTGMPKKKKKSKNKKKPKTNTVALGLKAIDFCASVQNPSGVNKQAALLESNGNDFKAVELYEDCWKNGKANALLLFNLGWCLVNEQGVERADRARGIDLWKEATKLAPDEGSEEAAWNLYQEYVRDDPKEAQRWLDLAEDLGYTSD